MSNEHSKKYDEKLKCDENAQKSKGLFSHSAKLVVKQAGGP